MKFLGNFFVQNAYPISLFEGQVAKYLSNCYSSTVPLSTVPKLSKYLVFPYLGYNSKKIEKEIKALILRFYPQLDLRLIFTNNFTIGSLFRHKEATPTHLCSSIVYKFICERCNSSYVGSTIRHLKTRVDEHRGVSSRTGQMLGRPVHSEIRNHCHSNNHPFNISHFSIIDKSINPLDLRILESIHIHNIRPVLNSYQSSADLNILK